MAPPTNDLGQPIGAALPGWAGCVPPGEAPLIGHYCQIEPIDPERHAESLFAAYQEDKEGRVWTYMPDGPFDDFATFAAWLSATAVSRDPFHHAIIDRDTGQALGKAAYLRIDPPNGVIEVGHIAYAPNLQRSRIATEAMYLMMAQVFDQLGYRRYEWKCDALNAASRRAATRYGFRFDGIFEQAVVYKGRNRDTAWYSILDKDWPRVKAAYQAWLDPANFDAEGRQRHALAAQQK